MFGRRKRGELSRYELSVRVLALECLVVHLLGRMGGEALLDLHADVEGPHPDGLPQLWADVAKRLEILAASAWPD